jgi:hypothetical protein
VSAAVLHGHIALDFDYGQNDKWEPEPTTPLSTTARAAIAHDRADLATYLHTRFGAHSLIAQVLDLDDPITLAMEDMQATADAIVDTLGRLTRACPTTGQGDAQ